MIEEPKEHDIGFTTTNEFTSDKQNQREEQHLSSVAKITTELLIQHLNTPETS